MQTRRILITTGTAIIFVVLAMSAREWPLIGFPLLTVAIFLIVWGRAPDKTKAMIANLPGAAYLLKALRFIEVTLDPRDEKLEAHLREIFSGYDTAMRNSLRTLKNTRNAKLILEEHWKQFYRDGLVVHKHAGPEDIKSELREAVGHVLEEFDDT